MNLTRLLCLALPLAVCAETAEATTLAQIRDRGFMVAGIVAEQSVFGGAADGKAGGFDGALIDGLAKSVPFQIHQQVIARDDLEAALRDGTIDIVASAVEVTAPRQTTISFTAPVAEATRYYLKRKGDGRIKAIGDLGGKPFGSRSSSNGLPELTEFEHRLAKAGGALGEGTEYPTYQDAAKNLVAKKIDYVIGDLADLRVAVQDDPNDLEIGEAVSQKIYVAWATAKDSPEIAGLVSDYLAQARKSGELQALQTKFLGGRNDELPENVAAKDWWAARDKPAVFPIPTVKDPD